MFGAIPGIAVGRTFANRRALFDAGVHRTLQAGIVGRAAEGAESIVLAGGYVDDEDHGDVVIYTGHGGNDPATGRQVADQELTKQNLAIVRNEDNGIPIRVVRKNPKTQRYSYDGLYRVVSHWHERGKDGFRIQRFRLESILLDPAGLGDEGATPLPPGKSTPARRTSEIQRVVRITEVARSVKQLHDSTCQFCGTRLLTPSGPYAEAAHIRPLGRPHNGPDVPGNVLCLCPNCHVLFDKKAVSIDPKGKVLGALRGVLRKHSKHTVDQVMLEYHRENRFTA